MQRRHADYHADFNSRTVVEGFCDPRWLGISCSFCDSQLLCQYRMRLSTLQIAWSIPACCSEQSHDRTASTTIGRSDASSRDCARSTAPLPKIAAPDKSHIAGYCRAPGRSIELGDHLFFRQWGEVVDVETLGRQSWSHVSRNQLVVQLRGNGQF